MPFTPFHLGAAMLVKPAAGSRFSVISFGLAQIVIDIEPGIGMLRGTETLHGASHTVIGAIPVSYTHLDVYKRQGIHRCFLL